MNLWKTLILILALYGSHPSEGQSFINKLKTGLEARLRQTPVEKVYLHVDRGTYMAGETIFFSVYTTEGYTQKPSTLSKNIFVELFSEDTTLLTRTVIQVNEGRGNGHFDLNDTLKTGTYQLRAYSKWMQNFDPGFFFKKNISVFSLYENQQTDLQPSTPPAIDVQFFPEGGDWVSGIESKIAFKAINDKGQGVHLKGKLVDDQNKEIADVIGTRLGFGSFTLKPESNHTYRLKIDGLTSSFSLPMPKPAGYVLKVINDPSQKSIQFRVSTNIHEAENKLTVVVQCRGRLLYSGTSVIAAGELNGAIPRVAFLRGVNHITVFDRNNLPVAERLFYVDREDELHVEVKPSDSVLEKRKKVSFDIRITDLQGKPVKSSLSVVATDDSQVEQDRNRETISSSLLLSSDIRGTIESPSYYFDPANEDRTEMLDLLLLIHGWRRFTWKEIVLSEPWKPQFAVERGFPISGTMRRTYSNKPVPDGKVSFLSKDFTTIFGAVETDAKGRFHVADIQVAGPVKSCFRANTRRSERTCGLILIRSR